MTINSIGSSSFIQPTQNIQQASERIASGKKINSAQDDAAGLAIANRLSAQINEFSQSARNANDGVSFLQTAEGGLSSLTQNVDRIRELSLQAANGTLNDSDRQALNEEAQQLKGEIVRTIDTTSFNGQTLLNNDNSVSIQVGTDGENAIDTSIDNLDQFLSDLSFDDLDLSTSEGAQSALGLVDQFQQQIDSSSASIGAQVNRLDSTINSLFNSETNAAESRSRIEDSDFAKEISALAKNDIQNNVAIALQSQANENGKNVLRLLGL